MKENRSLSRADIVIDSLFMMGKRQAKIDIHLRIGYLQR
jgi:hypothetical protein